MPRLLLLFAVLAASGCEGTYSNLMGYEYPFQKDRLTSVRFYGGVRNDAAMIAEFGRSGRWDKVRHLPVLTVDMAFSAVGDTVTLPYVAAIQRQGDSARTPIGNYPAP